MRVEERTRAVYRVGRGAKTDPERQIGVGNETPEACVLRLFGQQEGDRAIARMLDEAGLIAVPLEPLDPLDARAPGGIIGDVANPRGDVDGRCLRFRQAPIRSGSQPRNRQVRMNPSTSLSPQASVFSNGSPCM